MTDAPRYEAVTRDNLRPLAIVLGATGSGKSELALRLAGPYGEIVNFDSVQVYRGFNIGAAKIPICERRGVPHHLIDCAEPVETFTAGRFAREARRVIGEISGRGHIPVLVGGTGFYLRAVLEGLSPAPERHEKVRQRLEAVAARRPLALHRFLRRFDGEAAGRIHQNDLQKLIRAVEMIRIAGKPVTETQALPRQALRGYRTLKIGLLPDRQLLYERLNQRAARMFDSGLLEETAALLASGVPVDAKPMQSLGYKQAVRVLSSEVSVAEAIADCQTRTRQYAKRQMTWFRQERDVFWLPGFGWDEAIQEQAMRIFEEWRVNAGA